MLANEFVWVMFILPPNCKTLIIGRRDTIGYNWKKKYKLKKDKGFKINIEHRYGKLNILSQNYEMQNHGSVLVFSWFYSSVS